MPLLPPLITHTPDDQQLYASQGSGGAGTTAPQFTATGLAGAGGFVSTGAGANVYLNNGSFVSGVTTTGLPGTGADVLVLDNESLINRWGIGFANAETGVGSGGADFAIHSYDNLGAPIGTPLSIVRNTGVVTATGLQSSQTAFYQLLTTATQNGTPAPGITSLPMGGSFTVPRTGLYLFSAQTLTDVGPGPGEDIVVGASDYCAVYINTVPPLPGLVSSTFTMVTPISMTYTTNSPAGVDTVVTATNIIPLTAGITYAMTAQVYSGIGGTLRFPASAPGGVTFYGRLVPLC